MLQSFYQNIPLHVDPIAFALGSFSIRWYALSYIVGFGVVYMILMWRLQRGEFCNIAQISNVKFLISNKKTNSKHEIRNTKYEIRGVVTDYLLVAFFAALIGGRIGFVLFYDLKYFLSNPLAIISPYDQNGTFVGIFGMSYHGALLGILAGSWIFLKRKKINFLAWADFVAPAVALGYFFGRVGNFLNGELYGRVTDSSFGMHFLADPAHLRHPSQLYEAVLEGLLLFALLWKMRNLKLKQGSIFAFYIVGYGVLRIIAEQFRQPDAGVGFLFGYFTMGQLLSLAMVICGTVFLVLKKEN